VGQRLTVGRRTYSPQFARNTDGMCGCASQERERSPSGQHVVDERGDSRGSNRQELSGGLGWMTIPYCSAHMRLLVGQAIELKPVVPHGWVPTIGKRRWCKVP